MFEVESSELKSGKREVDVGKSGKKTISPPFLYVSSFDGLRDPASHSCIMLHVHIDLTSVRAPKASIPLRLNKNSYGFRQVEAGGERMAGKSGEMEGTDFPHRFLLPYPTSA